MSKEDVIEILKELDIPRNDKVSIYNRYLVTNDLDQAIKEYIDRAKIIDARVIMKKVRKIEDHRASIKRLKKFVVRVNKEEQQMIEDFLYDHHIEIEKERKSKNE